MIRVGLFSHGASVRLINLKIENFNSEISGMKGGYILGGKVEIANIHQRCKRWVKKTIDYGKYLYPKDYQSLNGRIILTFSSVINHRVLMCQDFRCFDVAVPNFDVEEKSDYLSSTRSVSSRKGLSP